MSSTRSEREYPLFIPPEHLAVKKVSSWNAKEAKEYSAWLLGVIDKRTREMLGYLGITETGSPTEVLEAAGEQAVQYLRQQHFSTDGELTSRGYALAADMGLLAAKFLHRDGAGSIRWEVLRRPKREMSYNLPVLKGFAHDLHIEPVAGAISEAMGVLRGSKGANAWARIYEFWIERVLDERENN